MIGAFVGAEVGFTKTGFVVFINGFSVGFDSIGRGVGFTSIGRVVGANVLVVFLQHPHVMFGLLKPDAGRQ